MVFLFQSLTITVKGKQGQGEEIPAIAEQSCRLAGFPQFEGQRIADEMTVVDAEGKIDAADSREKRVQVEVDRGLVHFQIRSIFFIEKVDTASDPVGECHPQAELGRGQHQVAAALGPAVVLTPAGGGCLHLQQAGKSQSFPQGSRQAGRLFFGQRVVEFALPAFQIRQAFFQRGCRRLAE